MIRETTLVSFYAKRVWPIHRKLAARHLSARCRRCGLNSHATTIGASGLCALCTEETPLSAAAKRDHAGMTAALLDLVRKTIADHPHARFHGLLLFSGGKDSCYMLSRLASDHPELRILCVTVDNSFCSPIAIDNVNVAIERSGAAHLWVRPPRAMMKKMFRHAFLRNEPGEPMGLVDFFDGMLMSDIGRNVARRFDIPLIFMGLSPEQVEGIVDCHDFIAPPEETSPRTHVGAVKLADVFDDGELGWFWGGASAGEELARLVFPLYAWGVNEIDIKAAVHRSGLLRNAILDPVLTNHLLIVPMVIVDYVRHGYFTYEPEFAEMIRAGRARYGDWVPLFEILEYAARTGKLLGRSFDLTLAELGLNRTMLGIPGNGIRVSA